jgi:ribonuclease T1
MPADQRRTARLALVLLTMLLVLGTWWWAAQDSGGQGDGRATQTSTSRSGPVPRASAASAASAGEASGLPVIELAQLPAPARHTLELISAGGPYPYSRDGVVFQNRERLLPRKASGYYHEYTVPTPGEADRGARRIITGNGGERYWTPDHYTSFSVIVGDTSQGGGP